MYSYSSLFTQQLQKDESSCRPAEQNKFKVTAAHSCHLHVFSSVVVGNSYVAIIYPVIYNNQFKRYIFDLASYFLRRYSQ